MKKIVLAGFGAIVLFCQCSKHVAGDTPACIQLQVEILKNRAKQNPPAEINEYLYNGKTVYLISADCCDQYDKLVDGNCNYLCSPSGGLTGKGDGKCADFFQNAKYSRLIWKDER